MKYFIYTFILISLNSCDLAVLWGSGHGSIGGYSYSLCKDTVENAITNLVKKNANLIILKSDEQDDYTSLIIVDKDSCFYVFRFYGNSEYWDSHPNSSEIFIASGKVGEGNYKLEKELNYSEKNKLLNVFEKNFINPLSNELNVKIPQVIK